MYLSANLKYLRKKSGKTQDGLSAELKIGRTTIANYESGISEPNVETLCAFAKHFNVSVDDLVSKNLEVDALIINAAETGQPFIDPKANKTGTFTGVPRVITVDKEGIDNIIYVPVKARAGYLLGYGDAEFMEQLPTFRLPGLSNATYRMFEVEGPSMAPNILNGDRLIGEWVENLNDIRDNRVYIVVHSGGVAVKRVINRLKERGKLYLKSDTIAHRHDFPTIEIDPADISEIWYGRLKISSDFSEPSEVYQRLGDLEMDMLELKQKLTPGDPTISLKKPD